MATGEAKESPAAPATASPAADRLQEVGERIERLLEGGVPDAPVAREDARELVRIVTELYGSGLERLLELAHETGALTGTLVERLADDELVSALLLIHGLHPFGVRERVERALRGEAEVVEVTDEGVVRVRLLGHGCGSVPAEQVQARIEAVAPEAVRVEFESTPSLIPVESLTARLRTPA